MFLGKGVLKTCGKHTGEPPCRSVIPIKWQYFGSRNNAIQNISLGLKIAAIWKKLNFFFKDITIKSIIPVSLKSINK